MAGDGATSEGTPRSRSHGRGCSRVHFHPRPALPVGLGCDGVRTQTPPDQSVVTTQRQGRAGLVLSWMAPKVAFPGHTAVPSAGPLTPSAPQERLSVPNLRGNATSPLAEPYLREGQRESPHLLAADRVVTLRQITPERITSGLCLGKLRQTSSVA